MNNKLTVKQDKMFLAIKSKVEIGKTFQTGQLMEIEKNYVMENEKNITWHSFNITGCMSADYYLRALESKGCITRIKRGTWQVNK